MPNLRNYQSAAQRRRAMETELNLSLSHIGNFSLDESLASTKNCENMIGAIQVPLGIAGPLKITGTNFAGEFLIPLATTEGALVASINRGAKAITESAAAKTISKQVGITRAPVFVVENLHAGQNLIDWTENHFKDLKMTCESTSSHLKLLEIKSSQLGRNVYLRFRFDTQDAMGMNMATIATSAAAELIESQTTAHLVSLSGNMCVDKKPNLLNFLEGRGIQAAAEVVIPKTILKEVLKTESTSFFEVAQRKIVYGSVLSGSIGANAQAANVLAALFLATGQDMAHIAEAACAVTTIEQQENGSIYISVLLPDLPIGTVGGGTGLETQKECLKILGINGGDNGKNAKKFAEIIAAAVLAGEISLLASLAENSLARAHRQLGRGEKI